MLFLGECNGNAADAVIRHRKKYYNWRVSNLRGFLSVYRPLSADNERIEKQNLEAAVRQPTISTRRVATRAGT
jgi:hypothetical protein